MARAPSRGCDAAPMSTGCDALHDWYPCLKNRAGASARNPVARSNRTESRQTLVPLRFEITARTTTPPWIVSVRGEEAGIVISARTATIQGGVVVRAVISNR